MQIRPSGACCGAAITGLALEDLMDTQLLAELRVVGTLIGVSCLHLPQRRCFTKV